MSWDSDLAGLRPRLQGAWENTCHYLMEQRVAAGQWEGHLSSSALSTATAVMAMRSALRNGLGDPTQRQAWESLVQAGCRWLTDWQNADGGWGDTTHSISNISTTALAWAALTSAVPNGQASTQQTQIRPIRPTQTRPEPDAVGPTDGDRWGSAAARQSARQWLREAIRPFGQGDPQDLPPQALAAAIRHRYGKDHTFSVPILTALVLQGCLGPQPQAWRLVPQLPFEFAAFPRTWYAKLRLRVVSYALPALIAIGLVRFRLARDSAFSPNPWSWFRRRVTPRVLRILREIQPTSGGYLEATPLTSFVCLSLIEAGWGSHPVVTSGLLFLSRSTRSDGSWPIDTNLATWASTLSISALQSVSQPRRLVGLDLGQAAGLRDWLLQQQYRQVHPYTQAAPGGWAWTDLTGGVPDADDTPGGLLALAYLDEHLADSDPRSLDAAQAAVTWLLGTQNADGGLPTFCRGWGQLPFDRSSPDLTAHALRAWLQWWPRLTPAQRSIVETGLQRAIRYLLKTQRLDGAWVPLWFGSQSAPNEENPVYGTSRVLLAWAALDRSGRRDEDFAAAAAAGGRWLLTTQNRDGGWGGAAGAPSTIEETALALEGLAAILRGWRTRSDHRWRALHQTAGPALLSGARSLMEQTRDGTHFPAAPIGFYFAKLWYAETTYPIVFSAAAWRSILQFSAQTVGDDLNGSGTP